MVSWKKSLLNESGLFIRLLNDDFIIKLAFLLFDDMVIPAY